MGSGRPATIGCCAGDGKASGSRSSRPCRARPKPLGKSSGRWSRSTGRRSGPISTRRERATPPRRPSRRQRRKKGEVAPADEALGRSRGGFTTKLHLAAEGRGRPLTVRLTAGQRHESTQLEPVLDGIRVPRPRGRPRKRPDQAALDKGYSYPKCRKVLRCRGIRHVIPERKDQRAQRQAKGGQGGRPPRFDREVYRQRSWAERCVNRLKQFRRVATRYEKRAANYLAFVHFAAIIIWLRA
jgi:transposase